MDKMRQWSMLTAVGVIAVLAAGWFLLVSPQKSKAASLRAQVTSQESTNSSRQSRVNQLEQQKKGLPAQQKLLNQIAAKIPDNPELPALIRQLSDAARTSGVDLVSLQPGDPALVTSAVTRPVAHSTASTSSGSTSTAATLSHPAASSPLAQIPVQILVQGSYFNVTSFFRSLEKMTRAVLVSNWSLSPAGSSSGGAASGTGADSLPADTLTGSLTGVIFESPTVAAPAAVTPVAPAK
jgi:Tfp pilus assembly protein PilO